jgi:hypothetical protein
MSAADTEHERPAWIVRKDSPMMNEPCINGLEQASAR